MKNCDLGPENVVALGCGLGQRFQDLSHSFSLYRPTLSLQITYISFLSLVNLLASGFVHATSTLSLNRLMRRLQTCKEFERSNERKLGR